MIAGYPKFVQDSLFIPIGCLNAICPETEPGKKSKRSLSGKNKNSTQQRDGNLNIYNPYEL